MRVICTIFATIVVAVTLSGCGDSATTTTAKPAPPPTMNIVETAESLSDLSSLVDALKTANLVDALSAPGSMTVFAPTNEAFTAIASTTAGLSAEALGDVLKYHVIGGVSALSTELTPNEQLPTLFEGKNLTVDLSVKGTVTITGETNSVQVTIANTVCTNGVVHVVNAVLIPNDLPSNTSLTTSAGPTAAPTMNIVETAESLPDLSSLVDALKTANLVDALSAPGSMTVFAPTNEAFAAIAAVTATLSAEALGDVLKYHVISGVSALSTELTPNEQLKTLFDEKSLTVDLSVPGTVTITGETNSVQVTIANVVCTNGVVHVVSAVLIPNGLPSSTTSLTTSAGPTAAPTMNIVQTAESIADLSSLVTALTTANLVDALSAPGSMTVFAPTNDAFTAIESLTAGMSPEILGDVLKYHVIGGVSALSTELTPNEQLLTLFAEKSLTVDLSVPGTVTITGETNSVHVTIANTVCTNGVVHVVDAVLVPTLPTEILT